jgi:hypothetical protein
VPPPKTTGTSEGTENKRGTDATLRHPCHETSKLGYQDSNLD